MVRIITKKRYNELVENEKNLFRLITMPDNKDELLKRKKLLENMMTDVNTRLQVINDLLKKVKYAKKK